jgi:type VI secretion system protein ImpI
MVFCEAAGIPAEALQRRGSAEVAAELGAVFRLVTEQTIGLLRLRAAAKRMTKADRTMVGTSQNNALKLAPTPQEALTIMIGKTNPGYLDALSSFREGFEDIKSHEGATYAAMQAALVRLMEDFAPEKIEQKTGSGVLGSKKARAWEIYTEQWSSKQDSENGLLDVFLDYFRAAYDKAEKS